MATIIRAFFDAYHFINEEVADPRTQNWFLIGSPLPGVLLLSVYLYFIYNLGPRLMAKKKPFNLDRIMQAYDLLQIFLSGYLTYKALDLGWWKHYRYICEPVDFSMNERAVQVAATVWLYFIVKIIDLLDTVFFVLRKKQHQVSFLHVYHHAGMVFGSWGATKYLPGGHLTLLGLVNSFVHMVMYTHYLVTSLKITKPWWKKYITQMQLVQFFILLVHFSMLIIVKECDFPRWPAAVFIPQNLFMIVLFGEFYYKTYMKTKKKVEPEANGTINKDMSNGKIAGTRKIVRMGGPPSSPDADKLSR